MFKLLVLTIILSTVNCQLNGELSIGDACSLSEGQEGICSEIMECEPVKKLLSERKFTEVVNCGFRAKIPIVCCPRAKKFIGALCKSVQRSEHLNLNIVGGEKAEVGEFPFQVALGRKTLEGNLDFNCGGSLIADDVVLTAAHCLNNKALSATMVRLGRTSLNLTNDDDDSTAEDIDIQTVVLHPKYKIKTKHNDIALLKLKKPASLTNPTVRTVCLSTSEEDVPANLTITGFGINDFDTKTRSDWLLKGIVEKVSIDDCKTTYKVSRIEVIDNQYCAHSRAGVDACQGDSGGPLSYTHDGIYYLHGLTSYGAGCGSPTPSIYTKVAPYLNWINDEMSKFES